MRSLLFILFIAFCFSLETKAQDDLYSPGKTLDQYDLSSKTWGNSKKNREKLIRDYIDSIKRRDPHIIVSTIKKNQYVRDKVFIVNKSSFFLNKTVLAIINGYGKFVPVVQSESIVSPFQTVELVSFSNNELARLRGQLVALKLRGTNIPISKGTPQDNSALITSYDYKVLLKENKHDLFIEVYDAQTEKRVDNSNIMDF